jgi:Protein of unknown function (DUF2510)
MSYDQSPAPGWYPAPHANNEQRYWDGTKWLEPEGSPVVNSGASPEGPGGGNAKTAQKGNRNILAVISLVVAGVGLVFACIPGALIVGWVLLPIGFVLAIVSLFLRGRGKGFGVAGLIVSIVGTVVGVVVFLGVVSDAFGGDTTVVTEPSSAAGSSDQGGADEETSQKDSAPVEGTREAPYALGTTITSDEWKVTINSVKFAADDAVEAANQFNDEPQKGNEYILVNATLTYVGDDKEGGLPAVVGIE